MTSGADLIAAESAGYIIPNIARLKAHIGFADFQDLFQLSQIITSAYTVDRFCRAGTVRIGRQTGDGAALSGNMHIAVAAGNGSFYKVFCISVASAGAGG